MENDKIVDELNKHNEHHVGVSGQTIQEDNREDVEEVLNSNKSLDQVERMMSSEEILFAAQENGLYINMLYPCLAANISINDRILQFFKEPIKPVELSDKVKDVMNILLAEISQAQNGLVFNVDGTINVSQSLKQSIDMGRPPVGVLSETIPDNVVEEIRNNYLEENSTNMFNVSTVSKQEVIEKLERVFDLSKENAENNVRAGKEYQEFYGDEPVSDIEKNKRYEQRASVDMVLVNTKNKLQMVVDEYEAIEDKFSPEAIECKRQIKALVKEIEDCKREKVSVGNPEQLTMQAVKAKQLWAEMRILKAIGVPKQMLDEKGEELKALNQSGRIDVKDAIDTERFECTVERKTYNKLFYEDATNLKKYYNFAARGEMHGKDVSKALNDALKVYLTYQGILRSNSSAINMENARNVFEFSKMLIKTVNPKVFDINDNLDSNVIIEELGKIPNYEHVELTSENLESVLIETKAEEIDRSMKMVTKAVLKNNMVNEVKDINEFVNELANESDLEFYVQSINLLRKLEDYDLGIVTKDRVLKRISKEPGLENVGKIADTRYDMTKDFLNEKLDGIRRDNAIKKFAEFNSLSPEEKQNLSKNDRGKILSAAISVIRISQDDSELSKQIMDNVRNIFKQYIPDALREDGTIDEEKMVEAFKEDQVNGKYALPVKAENVEGFYKFHDGILISKIQDRLVPAIFDRIKKEKVKDALITDSEAKAVIHEKGVVLDTSAITEPKKDEVPKIIEEEVKKVVVEKGENIHVADSLEQDKKVVDSLVVDEPSVVEPPVNKVVEEMGNSSKPIENKINSELLPVENKKTKGFLSNLVNRVKNFIKDKLLIVQTGSDDSSNNDSTSSTSSGTVVESDKKQQSTQNQINPLVQQFDLDLKAAQEAAKKSELDVAVDKDVEK